MNPIDLEQDLRDELEAAAVSMGFKLAKGKKFFNTILDYLTARNKQIEQRSRQVLICPDLCFSLSNRPFHSKKKEIDAIINIARQGGNLNPFLSTQTVETNAHDYMRSEWFIYHLHTSLTRDKKKPAFVKRSDLLLFAYIDDDYIVFLGTEKHGKGVFADTKWLELIHAHFPKVLEKYKSDCTDISVPVYNAITRDTVNLSIDKLSSESINALREKGYSLGFVKIGDVVYFNPGIGIMTSGHGLLDVKQANSILGWIADITRQLTQYHDVICKFLNVNHVDAVFKVGFPENIPDKLCLCEMTTCQLVLEFPCHFDLGELNVDLEMNGGGEK